MNLKTVEGKKEGDKIGFERKYKRIVKMMISIFEDVRALVAAAPNIIYDIIVNVDNFHGLFPCDPFVYLRLLTCFHTNCTCILRVYDLVEFSNE